MLSSNARPKYKQFPSVVQISGSDDGVVVRRRSDETPYQRARRFLLDNFPGVSFLIEEEGEYCPKYKEWTFEVWGGPTIIVLS